VLPGEEQAWKILSQLTPEDVCIRAKVEFNKLRGIYILKSFLQDIVISLNDECTSSAIKAQPDNGHFSQIN
jgi:hypothetical protein